MCVVYVEDVFAFFGWSHGTIHEPAIAQKNVNSILPFKKYFVTVFSAKYFTRVFLTISF